MQCVESSLVSSLRQALRVRSATKGISEERRAVFEEMVDELAAILAHSFELRRK